VERIRKEYDPKDEAIKSKVGKMSEGTTALPHIHDAKYNYKYVTKSTVRLYYREEKTAILGKDFHRWYQIGYCNVAYVECYEPGTRMGTKEGSNFAVHMAHRRKFNNTGDWFNTEDEMHEFIFQQLEAKI